MKRCWLPLQLHRRGGKGHSAMIGRLHSMLRGSPNREGNAQPPFGDVGGKRESRFTHRESRFTKVRLKARMT